MGGSRKGVDSESLHNDFHRNHFGRPGDLYFFTGLASDNRSSGGDSGLIGRNVRDHGCTRFFIEHVVSVWHRAGDRNRRR